MRRRIHLAPLLLAFSSIPLLSQSPQPTIISVDATHPGAAISPSEFGIFFEDINFGADGGLYPELIKNRSFEFSEPLTGWHEVLAIDSTGKGLVPPKGELAIHSEAPLNASNPHYLRVRAYDPGYAFYNVGYRGIGVEAAQNTASPPTSALGREAPKPSAPPSPTQKARSSAAASSKASTMNGRNTKPPSAPTPPTSTRA